MAPEQSVTARMMKLPGLDMRRISAAGGKAAGASVRIVEVALCILLAILAARILLAFLAPLPTPQGDALASAVSAPSVRQAPVLAKNPFPVAAIASAPVDAALDLAETSLDLTLTGVWPHSEDGSAIIRKPDGKERRFAVGETIVSGVRLVSVYTDQVIIEQNGVREALRFESKAPASSVVPIRSVGRSGSVSVQQLSGALQLAMGKDDNGRPAMVIKAGQDKAAFARIGFKDGDILRSINGAPAPTDQSGVAALLSTLSGANAATLMVQRDGALTPVTLSIAQSGSAPQSGNQ